MHRFFVAPEALGDGAVGGAVRLAGDQAHQIANVLRLHPGERVRLLDDAGWEYTVELTEVGRAGVVGRIERRSLATGEPRLKITLYQGLPRTGKFELVLQKCTELGVCAFVPLVTRRSVVSTLAAAQGLKLERWRRILVEAAEQSGRGRVPALAPPMLFEHACERAAGLSLLLWEGERERGLRGAVAQGFAAAGGLPLGVNLFVGPEGGFEPREVETARGYGILPVGLGPRILRTETAGLAAAAALLWASGDFGSVSPPGGPGTRGPA